MAHGVRETRAANTPVEGNYVHLHARSHDIGCCPLRGSRLPMNGLLLPTRRPSSRQRTLDPLAVEAQSIDC